MMATIRYSGNASRKSFGREHNYAIITKIHLTTGLIPVVFLLPRQKGVHA